MKKHDNRPIKHPSLPATLSFNRCTHTHCDNAGKPYTFETKYLAQFFQPFDSPAVAKMLSARTGKSIPEILAEWKATVEYGEEIHAHAEARLKGAATSSVNQYATPADLAVVDSAICMLAPIYETLGVKQVVFDPLYPILCSSRD